AGAQTPVAEAAGAVIALDFADEMSVVQTRFATTELALLRAHLGHDMTAVAAAAETALAGPLPAALTRARQFTFLGTGWTYGLANEAALKLREAAGMWTEAYPALDVTYHVAGVDWSGVNRPQQVSTAPGGKGLNVARTLRALGADVRVVGLAGGVTGEAVAAGLAAAGVPGSFTPIAGPTRRTFAVVDTSRHDTALFNEPGPVVTVGEYHEFLVL